MCIISVLEIKSPDGESGLIRCNVFMICRRWCDAEPPARRAVGRSMKLSRLKRFAPLIGVLAFAGASILVWREVRQYGLAGLMDAVRQIPRGHLLWAALGAAGSYATLTLFDALAVRYAGHRLAYARVALASFVSLAIGHTLGLAPLGSGALRARYYGRWGLDAEAIGKIILFCAATVTIGQTALAGIVLLVEPGPVAAWLHLAGAAVRGVGVLCLALVAAYLVASWWVRRPVTIRGWHFALPSLPLAVGQVLAGVLNFLFLTGALYALLAGTADVGFWTVAAIYVLASVAALVSHVPGGLGVIEFVVLAFLPQASTWGALIVFRILYYFVPLALGGLVLGLGEVLDRSAAPAAAERRNPAR
jgi:uncharacterized membrane protein YbhN (UPF0104 family)